MRSSALVPLAHDRILSHVCLFFCNACVCLVVNGSVSTLPVARHVDLTTLRSSSTKYRWVRVGGGMPERRAVNKRAGMGWQDLLTYLRHIKKTNPRRVVRRLTFNGGEKLGSLSNLSSVTAGLLTHIDLSRSTREIDFEQLGTNLPGLRGLGVSGHALRHGAATAQPQSTVVAHLVLPEILVRKCVYLSSSTTK